MPRSRPSTMALVLTGATAAVIASVSLGPAGLAATSDLAADRFGGHRILQTDARQQGEAARDSLALAEGRYVVHVSGVPVALQPGAATRTRSEQSRARAQARLELGPLEAAVSRLGGTVTMRYVDVVRGLAVTLPADAAQALRGAPGVLSVEPDLIIRRANSRADEFTQAATAWTANDTTGRSVTIAVIDTGIDYTHADFGGPGTVEAFVANDGTRIEPGSFPTAKVVAGYDLVGDDYDSTSDDPAHTVPRPDDDPLDCAGHGTHVAGTAAGFGVRRDGTAFPGPWTWTDARDLRIGPGTAPQALLMAYRVFGCAGAASTSVIVEAINMAVRDGADVINMSLGGSLGTARSLDAIASDNATKAGVVVVAAAGNDGPAPYLVGSPASAVSTIAVGAIEAGQRLPGASIASGSTTVAMVNANEGPLPLTAPIRVVRDSAGALSLGCTPADFGSVAGAIAVVGRGTCARVDKAAAGQAAGAVAVVMVNDSDEGLPPFEGPIDGVGIPFLGALKSDTAALAALSGATVTVRPTSAPNPDFARPTSFTSSGPVTGSSAMKPDLAAPGSGLVSAAVGTGSGLARLSGTSMATPVTAGIVALLREQHPRWTPAMIKAAMVGTAGLGARLSVDSDPLLIGSGVVQATRALDTSVLLMPADGASGVSFGVLQPRGPTTRTESVRLLNTGSDPVVVKLSVSQAGDGSGTFAISPRTLTVPAGGSRNVQVRFAVNAAQLSAAPAPASLGDLMITNGTVTAAVLGGRDLRMRVQAIVLNRSQVEATLVTTASGTTTLRVRNRGLGAGSADVYDWILADTRDAAATADVRAVGYQVLPAGALSPVPGDRVIVFAVTQYAAFSNPARNRYTLDIDNDADGTVDHQALGIDPLFWDTGNSVRSSFSGEFIALAVAVATGTVAALDPVAPLNGATVLIPVLASDIGVTADRPTARIRLEAVSFADDPRSPDTTDSVVINLWEPQRRGTVNGGYVELAAGERSRIPLFTRPPAAGEGPSLGWMVVGLQDRRGPAQAQLISATG